MSDSKKAPREPEFWLRGPIEGVPALLQPAAHALLQANAEIREALQGFPSDLLWKRPVETASVGFHLRHIAGAIDRLFTYAEGNMLSAEQLNYLSSEEKPNVQLFVADLVNDLEKEIVRSIDRLKKMEDADLTAVKTVGRQHIPSMTIGLLFHAAEHTMRHTGQLLVTAKILRGI